MQFGNPHHICRHVCIQVCMRLTALQSCRRHMPVRMGMYASYKCVRSGSPRIYLGALQAYKCMCLMQKNHMYQRKNTVSCARVLSLTHHQTSMSCPSLYPPISIPCPNKKNKHRAHWNEYAFFSGPCSSYALCHNTS